MHRGFPLALLAASLALFPSAQAAGNPFLIREFPMPKLAKDDFGQPRRIGFLGFLRELNAGGVHGVDDVDFLDSDYAVIDSSSLPLLAAWLEATCHSVGLDLQTARSGPFDGTVTARLLETSATLASVRSGGASLAMPIGTLICRRHRPWGSLPGDDNRDAYALVVTDRGLLVYDPPTRQLVKLSQFPNSADILNIQF
jgi:hypothetical protein